MVIQCKNLISFYILPDQRRGNLLVIYIYKTQSLSVCLSAIEIKLETFRYKQTYESYITFSREAKYGILISIRIVYGGLRAYIYSTVAKCATNSCHKITS